MGYIVTGFALIILIDLIPLLHSRSKRTVFAFVVIFTAALGMALLWLFDVQIPSTLVVIGNFLKRIGIGYMD